MSSISSCLKRCGSLSLVLILLYSVFTVFQINSNLLSNYYDTFVNVTLSLYFKYYNTNKEDVDIIMHQYPSFKTTSAASTLDTYFSDLTSADSDDDQFCNLQVTLHCNGHGTTTQLFNSDNASLDNHHEILNSLSKLLDDRKMMRVYFNLLDFLLKFNISDFHKIVKQAILSFLFYCFTFILISFVITSAVLYIITIRRNRRQNGNAFVDTLSTFPLRRLNYLFEYGHYTFFGYSEVNFAPMEFCDSQKITREEVDKLPIAINDQENSSCSICLKDFSKGESLRQLPQCKHNFHINCVDTWILKNATCPLCRCNVEPVSQIPGKK